jgi:hypothetical protein
MSIDNQLKSVEFFFYLALKTEGEKYSALNDKLNVLSKG